MRSSTFNKIIDYTLEKEDFNFRKRIQIERDPDDAGGTTVLGLDKASHGKTVDRLIELVESGRNNEAIEIAKDVYDLFYYSKHKDKNNLALFDKILDIKTVSKTFDLCVNTGNGQAAKFVRRGLNHLGAKLPVNSSFDDDVISNINKYSTDDFCKSIFSQTKLFAKIIEKFLEMAMDISSFNVMELLRDGSDLLKIFEEFKPIAMIDDDVLMSTIQEAKEFYIEISKKRNNKKYLKGWLNRVYDIIEYKEMK